jgi:uncharacterized circularly permuted ATP-grasp superfamily protein
VLQRVRLLERVMADIYGPQQLLARGLLPPALVQGHPGYLRAMHGVQPAGGRICTSPRSTWRAAPDGAWWVVTQRTQAPSGLGYLLENRLILSRLFPAGLPRPAGAAAGRHLPGPAGPAWSGLCPGGQGEPRIALLTPGPYNETYFEHAYLARYLGLTLVEGSDLTGARPEACT